MNTTLILKIPRFVPFLDNLTQFEDNPDMPVKECKKVLKKTNYPQLDREKGWQIHDYLYNSQSCFEMSPLSCEILL